MYIDDDFLADLKFRLKLSGICLGAFVVSITLFLWLTGLGNK